GYSAYRDGCCLRLLYGGCLRFCNAMCAASGPGRLRGRLPGGGGAMTNTDAAAAEAVMPKRRRADAERNEARVVQAAREVFAESGGDATLEATARRAGVGIGTLYRHFPTRDALVEAAFHDLVEESR